MIDPRGEEFDDIEDPLLYHDEESLAALDARWALDPAALT